MLINKIVLDGYRNISDSTLEFDKITSIVGVNNYGKSNFLEGISFGMDFIKNPARIKSNMMRYPGGLPINRETANRDFLFEIEGVGEMNKKLYIISYKFSFEWIRGKGNGQKVKYEELKMKEHGSPNARFSKMLVRDYNNALYKSSPTGRCNTNIEVANNELVLNKIEVIEGLFYKEVLAQLNNINIDIISFMNTDQAFSSIKINESSDVDLSNLDTEDGHNIPHIIYYLKENHNDKYEMLINAFKTLIPSIEEIEPLCLDFKSQFQVKKEMNIPFEVPEKYYEIRIKEKYNNQDTEIRNLSSGSRRIFSLLTSAIIADETNTSLIAFEELENSIHPYLFQKLIIILTNIVKNCRIVITSHSPYVIQYLDLNHIHIGIPTDNGTANFRKIKKSAGSIIMRHASELEVSIGDYLFDLLVEQYSDNAELNSYLEWGNDEKRKSWEEEI
ncbi:AAA family ATPase (plasmid) [Bacillus cereus]|uniref:AAA family ATPase n=1 Tax=Bacillus cereus TaxID=1396 RepID=UPI001FF42D4D|nr:ATP-binding protein [Bacillus cereus]UOX98937.1 AAA family ATPase [Bacillus cereus]